MLQIKYIGENVLREKAQDIDTFDERLIHLGEQMIDLMHDLDGIGLAAPQVGISKRLLVVDISPVDKEAEPIIFVNPRIVESEGELTMEEGCLSIPDVREEVTRPEVVTLQYQTVIGEKKTEKYSGWMARVLQHEIDHLDGILFIDYLSPVKQKLIENKFSA